MGDRHKNHKQTIRTLDRRDALKLVGAGGAGIVNPIIIQAVQSTSGCVVRPEQTEGPYFVDEKLNHYDIRSDPSDGSVVDGISLELIFRVSQIAARGCSPLEGAAVDVWHCDARGFYSDVRDRSFNTVGKKFLRGYQITDKSGIARFKTIYPGWYPGRTVHIHFKIRTDPASGARREFTSQLYFDDTLTDRVFMQKPYSGRGKRMLRNEDDFIYRAGGKELILALKEESEGYSATFEIALR
jgi:protocatechuate 3,4-dioxygenase beta subunit